MNEDIGEIENDYSSYPTYVTFRPRWTESDVPGEERRTASIYKRTKPKGSSLPKSTLRNVKIDIPNIEPDKPGRGRPRKDLPFDFSLRDPRRLAYEAFGTRQYEFEIRIGIIDKDAMHHGLTSDVEYSTLLGVLNNLGFNPFSPIEAKRKHFERHLASTIYATAKRLNKLGGKDTRHMTVRRAIESWARDVRDVVRDYIRGSISVAKPALSANTIDKRENNVEAMEGGDGLYKYGIDNALWETGTLEADMDYEVIPIEGGRVGRLGARQRAMLENARRIEKEIADRKKKREESLKRRELAIRNIQGAKSTANRPATGEATESIQEQMARYKSMFLHIKSEIRDMLKMEGFNAEGVRLNDPRFAEMVKGSRFGAVRGAYKRARDIYRILGYTDWQ